MKYLVYWKGFVAKNNIWEKEKDLENAKEAVKEFEERMNAEVRRQEKLDRLEERDFRRRELLEKYTTKMLYRWNNRKFVEEYLKKLERNWRR